MLLFIISWYISGLLGLLVLGYIFKPFNTISLLDIIAFIIISFAGYYIFTFAIISLIILKCDKIIVYTKK